jgi:hypothetical protein
MRSAMLVPVRGLLVLLIALGACAGDDAPLEPDGGTPVDASPDAPDPSAAFFAPDHLIEIAIELPAADWDEVRRQTRPSDLLIGADCQAAPFGSPFTSKLATVTIDGQRFAQVAVRKKGFLGSLDDDKPSLKLKLDEVIADQAIAGLTGLTLNNNRQDPSAVRQCLAFRVFAAAGVPAPRCNFAHVTVNGRDLGVFTHLEGVGKRLLARHFSDDGGRLYEGTLSDFRTGWLATFEPKTDEANPDRSDLEAVAAAAAVPDAQLESALAPVVDVERFLTYWAVETLLEHGDGYASNTNNFFVYRDPTSGRFDFVPWGTDGVMGAPGTAPPSTVFFANGVLARRLYQLPATRARLLAALDRVLATAWDETALLAEIDRMAALLAPVRVGDPFAVGVDLAAELDGVRAFVRTRRARIAPAIAAPPPWTNPPRTSFCFVELGPIHATFTTTFKTAEPPTCSPPAPAPSPAASTASPSPPSASAPTPPPPTTAASRSSSSISSPAPTSSSPSSASPPPPWSPAPPCPSRSSRPSSSASTPSPAPAPSSATSSAATSPSPRPAPPRAPPSPAAGTPPCSARRSDRADVSGETRRRESCEGRSASTRSLLPSTHDLARPRGALLVPRVRRA